MTRFGAATATFAAQNSAQEKGRVPTLLGFHRHPLRGPSPQKVHPWSIVAPPFYQ
jgi:hypothetical protein